METNEKTPEQLAAEQREAEKRRIEQEMAQTDLSQEGNASANTAPFGNDTPVSSPSVATEDKVAKTTPENEIPRPPEAPPVAIVPAVPDPSAVPSNIRQQEEVFLREREEFIQRNIQHFPQAQGGDVYPPAGLVSDVQFQQPGAASQQWERRRPLDEAVPFVTEKTRREMEAGQKRVSTSNEAKAQADSVREEQETQHRTEMQQLAGTSNETGEQLEAKRLEAIRRREIWGDGQVSRVIPPPPVGIATR